MHNIFDSALYTYVTVYLDDILVFWKNIEEHLEHLKFVLQKLLDHKLKGKLSKYSFGIDTVKYLGHII